MLSQLEIQQRIIELERMVQELQQALDEERKDNFIKSQFIGTAAHEFRTPLTTILNSADFLGMVGRTCNEEKYREHILKIQRAVNFLAEFSEDVLTISKIDTTNSQIKPARFLITEFFQERIAEISESNNHQHPISLNYSGNEKEIVHDKHLLQHIINNILDNSIKYSPVGNKITVQIELTNKAFIIIVRDNGSGISAEDQQHLFEPFIRGSNNTDTVGTGLGLSIIKKSVDILKGTISIESIVRSGTSITVSLPLIKDSTV